MWNSKNRIWSFRLKSEVMKNKLKILPVIKQGPRSKPKNVNIRKTELLLTVIPVEDEENDSFQLLHLYELFGTKIQGPVRLLMLLGVNFSTKVSSQPEKSTWQLIWGFKKLFSQQFLDLVTDL